MVERVERRVGKGGGEMVVGVGEGVRWWKGVGRGVKWWEGLRLERRSSDGRGWGRRGGKVVERVGVGGEFGGG